MGIGELFNTLFVTPILNLLILLYKGFEFVGVPFAFGFALIAATILIRLLVAPFMHAQMKSAHKLAKLKPHLDAASAKHKDDKTKLQQEHMRIYKEAGVNPMGGCLPLLLQMPIILALFQVFSKILRTNGVDPIDTINKAVYAPFLKVTTLDLSFFGTTLTAQPSQWQTAGIALLTIPLITAGLQYFQSRQMLAKTITAPAVKDPSKKEQEEDMATSMQKQMMFMTPLMFGWFAYTFPVGLSLYWNIFTVFGILQQHFVHKTTK